MVHAHRNENPSVAPVAPGGRLASRAENVGAGQHKDSRVTELRLQRLVRDARIGDDAAKRSASSLGSRKRSRIAHDNRLSVTIAVDDLRLVLIGCDGDDSELS